jgi:hypothetical protein
MKPLQQYKDTFISLLRGLKTCDDRRTYTSLRKSIRRVFQYYTEVLPRLVSVEADEYNKSQNNLDLQTIDAFNKKRGDLVLEHTIPIMSFIDYLLTLPEEKWIETITEYPGCCWITKQEDKKLKSFGFNNKRPDGWKKCYDICEIDLVVSK